VQLVVSDDHEGLKSAIARHFQGASHQRCQVHYARNLLGMVSFARRKELTSDLRAIFAAPDRNQALTIAASVAEKWRQKGNEKVAEHLEEHIESASAAWPSPSLTAGASAPPTAWRGSTRR
jgi:putative transposase